MFNRSFILVNQEKKIFTRLNEFDKKKKMFRGEYSILHNAYAEDSRFLSQFLLENEQSPLVLFGSGSEDYQKITNQYERFLENDVHKYIEEKAQMRHEQQRDFEMDRNLGQLQLSLVKKMVESQLETVQNQHGKSPSEHQVLLGKELSLQWVLHMIDDIVEKGNH